MAGLRNPIVSIAKCSQHDNYEEILKACRKVLDMLGGLRAIISTGDRVVIKPNLVAEKPYTTGATTNPNVVKALAVLSKEAGAAQVIIAEGSAIGHNTLEAFKADGLDKVAEECGCKLVDLTRDNFQHVANPAAKVFKRIRIPDTILSANVIINVPVMKTHDALGVTLGLKNMKGIIHASDKKRFHKWGLAQSIVDLNQIALPEITVMDGTIAMEGNGPGSGDPVGLGLIMASTDTVACDRVACEIMGFKPDEAEYIMMAGEQGLGCCDLEKIKVIGENISDVARPFKRTSLDSEHLKALGINLLACDACSGCSLTLKNYLAKLEQKGQLGKLEGTTFIYGQSAYIPEGVEGKIVRIGTCTRNLSGCDSTYIPGCPPHPHNIDEEI